LQVFNKRQLRPSNEGTCKKICKDAVADLFDSDVDTESNDEAAGDEAARRKVKSGPLIPCPICKAKYKLLDAVLHRVINGSVNDKCSLCQYEMNIKWGVLNPCGHSFHMFCFDELKDRYIKAQ
jgi:hypothetical protein